MTTFDPNSITPPNELLDERKNGDETWNDDCIFFARWGAKQAVEALNRQCEVSQAPHIDDGNIEYTWKE